MKTKLWIAVMSMAIISCTPKSMEKNTSEYEACIQEEIIDGLDSIFVKFAQAVGDNVAVSYVMGNDSGYYAWRYIDYIPQKHTIEAIINYVPARSLIYHQTLKAHDLKSAIWLFTIKPKVVIDRLSANNTWYSPDIRGEIKRKLIEYYDDSMGENIAIQIANITPDKTLTNYMGGSIESAIFKVNPSRIQEIYKKMTAYQISSYSENQSKCFEIGERAYLNANLAKVNCDDLAQLKMSGIITEEAFKKYFSKRPKSEKQSFDRSIWESGDGLYDIRDREEIYLRSFCISKIGHIKIYR